MPFTRQRPTLTASVDELAELDRVSRSRTESVSRVLRAKMLLRYCGGETVSQIAREMEIDRPRVDRTIAKALAIGVMSALDDLHRAGRPVQTTDEARVWAVSLACQKPVDLGYSFELWTTQLLAQHIRGNCVKAGHPSLSRLARGTVSKMLAANDIQPHKIRYYLDRRDTDFDAKMVQVLYVYKEVQMWRRDGVPPDIAAVISYDEKPGIQAIGNTAPDLMPVPGEHPTVARDHEYVRHGTLSLLAGIDLFTGEVVGIVRERHRSAEFVEFLHAIDAKYPQQSRIRIILDNHSAHISAETRQYLATKPNRFEFIFTPKHGSWLNLIESFFAKMARSMLRGIRVGSKEELGRRILLFLEEVNRTPVIFKWSYKLDEIQIV
jgi:transposase